MLERRPPSRLRARSGLLGLAVLAALVAALMPSPVGAHGSLHEFQPSLHSLSVFGPMCHPHEPYDGVSTVRSADFRAIEYVQGGAHSGQPANGWVQTGSVTLTFGHYYDDGQGTTEGDNLEGPLVGPGDPYLEIWRDGGWAMGRMDVPVGNAPGADDIAVYERQVDPPATSEFDEGFCVFGAQDDPEGGLPMDRPMPGPTAIWYFIGAHLPGDNGGGGSHTDAGERHAFDLEDRYLPLGGGLPLNWIIVLDAVSVEERLQASFSYSPNPAQAQEDTEFTDTSTVPGGVPVNRQWYCNGLGGGVSGSSATQTCVFPSKGSFTVCLRITVQASGESSVTCQSITVLNQPPVCSFIVLPPAQGENAMQFYDMSTDGDGVVVSWAWTFGDGGTSSLQNPLHTYQAEGQYLVRLRVVDEQGAPCETTRLVTGKEPINRPPAVRNVGDIVTPAGAFLDRVFLANDPDGDSLTYAMVDLPAGSSFDPATRRLTWQTGLDDVGLYPVALRVSDGKAETLVPFVLVVYVPGLDGDRDGIANDQDNCAGSSNGNQLDADGDGVGDLCDPDPGLPPPPEPTPTDRDGDGAEDALDNCPRLVNAEQADRDADRIGDACDADPDDATIRAMVIPAPDQDGDRVLDADDNCPATRNRAQTDLDGDRLGDLCDPDVDDDHVLESPTEPGEPADNCPYRYNLGQVDRDGDGLGDVCDEYPDYPGTPPAGLEECAGPCPQPYTPKRESWLDVYLDEYRVPVVVGAVLLVLLSSGVAIGIILWARRP